MHGIECEDVDQIISPNGHLALCKQQLRSGPSPAALKRSVNVEKCMVMVKK